MQYLIKSTSGPSESGIVITYIFTEEDMGVLKVERLTQCHTAGKGRVEM